MYYLRYILGMVIFGTIAIIVKNIDLPRSQVVLSRTSIATISFLLVFTFSSKKIEYRNIFRNFHYLFLSGVSLAFSWIFLFESFNYTNVSIAVWITYLAPMIVILLSPIFLKEALNLLKFICVIIALVGLYLISNLDIATLQFSKGIIYSLLSAITYAFIIIFNKKIKNLDGFNTTFVQMMIAAITMMVYVFIVNKETISIPDNKSIALVIILGVFHTCFACFLTFGSIAHLPTNAVAFLSYLDPIFTFMFAYLLLGEVLSVSQLVGAGLILLSALLAQIKK
ncbi:EamA family transporter [Gemella sp. GH3]|uniref:DMT family transporter n=1 Tax=unclassified Gemella TaxID=2624949 RepID=UPI0015D0175A|nr:MULTISPECIES: DMT family transporter [unclassified Gemella]MBF0713927.1 EamA family transporter [Gemella sp. GH3.1]NYS50879.1 EamA family transporter [Gemella sp. GH3]